MKLTKDRLKQIIKEELEVVLTNEEAGEIFGEDVQAQLEADEAGVDESNAVDASDELTGRVPDAGAQMLEQSIEDLLDPESEFYEGLSDEKDDIKTSPLERAMPSPVVRNVLETLYNFIMGGRMGEAVDKEEDKEVVRTTRVTPQSIAALKQRTRVGKGAPKGGAPRGKTPSQFNR